mgnify:CR=1 FL=1
MLDIEMKMLLAGIAASGAPSLDALPPVVGRQAFHQIVAAGNLPPADVQAEDRWITGAETPIQIRIYTPKSPVRETRGIVLYCHGGGFVMGDLNDYDSVCRTLSHDGDCLVVSVDYRLAPEHPFPAAVEDCHAALRWVGNNATALGADPQRIAVCGDSAGGNLAAVVAILARESGPQLSCQILIYPVTSATPGDLPSHTEFAEGYVLTLDGMRNFTNHYFGPSCTAPDFRGAPLLATDLTGLPPALVLVGGYDLLRDDGVAYADRLTEAGVPVTLVEYRGLSHGFVSMAGTTRGGRLALDQVSSALRLWLSPTAAREA